MPRIQILEDEDDGLTCRLCLASYWYKTEIHEHLKTVHNITDPEKYDREEKEKKLRRIKEEQQRSSLAKKQREERERKLREAKFGKSRGGTIKLTSPGARPQQTPGARPSFQYRDGAFICDLCKESFSDGNDMVTHWKSHVKKQQAESKSLSAVGRGRGRGRGRGGGGRGRPPLVRRESSDSNDRGKTSTKRDSSSGEDDDKSASSSGRKSGKRGDKGKPRWTAYLLWSTRKRRDVVVDHPDWTFAQIAKWISDEWKKIDADEKDELQKEAEEMNELGIRKLPRDDDGPDPEKDTTDEDSDFEEGYRKKSKPIMLKIKKEKKKEKKEKLEKDAGAIDGSDESDWEPVAEVLPPEREQTRSGRQRKRPSFFQEFESQENNLDSILQEFEETQAKEFGKPRVPKPAPKPATERKPRKRKPKSPQLQSEDQPVEVETLRSGRKRKVRRLMANFMDDEDEDEKLRRGASSDDDDFEPPPEEEVNKIEEHDDQIEEDEDEDDFEDDDDDDEERRGDEALPPKKRGRPKKILTDAEIEEATRAALSAKPATKPVIEITRVPKVGQTNGTSNLEPGEVVLPKVGQQTVLVNQVKDNTEQPLVTAGQTLVSAGQTLATVGQSLVTVGQPLATVGQPLVTVGQPLVSVGQPLVTVGQPSATVALPLVTTELPLATAGQSLVTTAHPLVTVGQPLVTARKSAPELQTGGDSLKSSFANESIEAEVEKGGGSEVTNHLVVDHKISEAQSEVPMNEEEALLATATTEQPQFIPETSGESNVVQMQSSDNKDNVNEFPKELVEESFTTSDTQSTAGEAARGPLSEEDLLTGPAHNLDDSTYKADYVDPNLDDIFK